MTATALLHEFRRLGVRLRADGARIIARPLSAVPPELRAAARTHETQLLRLLTQSLAEPAATEPAATTDVPSLASQTADEALTALHRRKGYTLPVRRIPLVRELAERLRGLAAPAAILAALQAFEAKLLRLGGHWDPELTTAIETVTGSFPGAWLVERQDLKLPARKLAASFSIGLSIVAALNLGRWEQQLAWRLCFA